MKGKNRSISGPELLLGGFGLLLIAGNLFNGISVFMVRFNGELMYGLFPAAYLLIATAFLFHIPALAFLIRTFRGTGRMLAGHWFIMLIGVLSAMAPIAEWAALHDIAENIMEGFSSSLESTVIFLAVALHIVFIVILLKKMSGVRPGTMEGEGNRIDDLVFKIVHGTGMLSGGLGLLFCASQAFLELHRYRPFLVAFYGVAFLAPYAIIRRLWRRTLRKSRSELDEKQKADMAAGALTALRSVLAAGTLIYSAGAVSPAVPERLQWFPILFFVGLFTFSLSVFRHSPVLDADSD